MPDELDGLLRAWRDDIDSEPFPLITDLVLPTQTRRRMPGTCAVSDGDTGGRPSPRRDRTVTGH